MISLVDDVGKRHFQNPPIQEPCPPEAAHTFTMESFALRLDTPDRLGAPPPSLPGLFNGEPTPNALPRGTLLRGKFRLKDVLGVGGFGIVYLAHDEYDDVDVAVKEYMPSALAGRSHLSSRVSLTSQSNADTFAIGLRSFRNEARLLARFRNERLPLLKVYESFEANNTAYMVMPVLRGRSAQQMRLQVGRPFSERRLRKLISALLPALERLHAENVLHRDISPDNIQIDETGEPILLDLGAARHVIADRTQSITTILKPGYAPIEQYGESTRMKQGPWTDLYALGATLHFMIHGKAPSAATARFFDPGTPLCAQPLPGYSTPFLHTIDWMLAPKPEDRPQSVAQLRSALETDVQRAVTLYPAQRPAKQAPPRHARWAAWSCAAVMLAALTACAWWWPRKATAPPMAQRPVVEQSVALMALPAPGPAAAMLSPQPQQPTQPQAPPQPPPQSTSPEVGSAAPAPADPPAAARPSAAKIRPAPGIKAPQAKAIVSAPLPLAPADLPAPPAAPPIAAPVAPAIEAAPAVAAPPRLASPAGRCSGKEGLALKFCVALVCGLPELHEHRECITVRARG